MKKIISIKIENLKVRHKRCHSYTKPRKLENIVKSRHSLRINAPSPNPEDLRQANEHKFPNGWLSPGHISDEDKNILKQIIFSENDHKKFFKEYKYNSFRLNYGTKNEIKLVKGVTLGDYDKKKYPILVFGALDVQPWLCWGETIRHFLKMCYENKDELPVEFQVIFLHYPGSEWEESGVGASDLSIDINNMNAIIAKVKEAYPKSEVNCFALSFLADILLRCKGVKNSVIVEPAGTRKKTTKEIALGFSFVGFKPVKFILKNIIFKDPIKFLQDSQDETTQKKVEAPILDIGQLGNKISDEYKYAPKTLKTFSDAYLNSTDINGNKKKPNPIGLISHISYLDQMYWENEKKKDNKFSKFGPREYKYANYLFGFSGLSLDKEATNKYIDIRKYLSGKFPNTPDENIKVYQDSGHIPTLACPEKVAKDVYDFLKDAYMNKKKIEKVVVVVETVKSSKNIKNNTSNFLA